jgi:hypothetical protein
MTRSRKDLVITRPERLTNRLNRFALRRGFGLPTVPAHRAASATPMTSQPVDRGSGAATTPDRRNRERTTQSTRRGDRLPGTGGVQSAQNRTVNNYRARPDGPLPTGTPSAVATSAFDSPR